jgi:hypothetical protein
LTKSNSFSNLLWTGDDLESPNEAKKPHYQNLELSYEEVLASAAIRILLGSDQGMEMEVGAQTVALMDGLEHLRDREVLVILHQLMKKFWVRCLLEARVAPLTRVELTDQQAVGTVLKLFQF